MGFEPMEPEGSTVFKTAPINHSGSPPFDTSIYITDML